MLGAIFTTNGVCKGHLRKKWMLLISKVPNTSAEPLPTTYWCVGGRFFGLHYSCTPGFGPSVWTPLFRTLRARAERALLPAAKKNSEIWGARLKKGIRGGKRSCAYDARRGYDAASTTRLLRRGYDRRGSSRGLLYSPLYTLGNRFFVRMFPKAKPKRTLTNLLQAPPLANVYDIHTARSALKCHVFAHRPPAPHTEIGHCSCRYALSQNIHSKRADCLKWYYGVSTKIPKTEDVVRV